MTATANGSGARKWEWGALGAAAVVIASIAVWAIAGAVHRERVGRVMLASTDGPLLVELKHAETGRTREATVPHRRAFEIEAGEYDVETRRDGRFSARSRIFVDAKTQRIEPLLAPNPPLWSMPKAESLRIPRGSDQKPAIIRIDERSLTRLDALTGEEQWSRKMRPAIQMGRPATTAENRDDPDAPLPPGRWGASSMVGFPAAESKNCGWIPDVNGDGADDLVLSSPTAADLLVLSGADGQVVWHATLAEFLTPSVLGRSRQFGTPLPLTIEAAPDCNEDGRADVLATFAIVLSETQVLHVLAAIDGVNGSPLWKSSHFINAPPSSVNFPLSPFTAASGRSARQLPNSAMTKMFATRAFGIDEPLLTRGLEPWIVAPNPGQNRNLGVFELSSSPLLIARLGQKRALVWTNFDRFHFIDFADGADLGVSAALPGALSQAPKLVRVSSRGPDRILATRERSMARTNFRASEFSLLDPRSPKPIWSVTVDGWNAPLDDFGGMVPSLPIVADLNGDGSDEIILPVEGTMIDNSVSGRAPEGALQARRSDSDAPLWARAIRCADQKIHHVQVGPDIDGDGWRDIFAATRYHGPGQERPSVHIDALSGAAGRTLWRLALPMPESVGPLMLPRILRFEVVNAGGDSADDGEIAALAIARQEPGDARTDSGRATYLIDLRAGAVVSEGPGLELIAADGDALFCLRRDDERSAQVGSQLWGEPESRALDVFLAPPRDGWGYAVERLNAIGDVNGDGIADLLGYRGPHFNRVLCVDGRTGRALWSRPQKEATIPRVIRVFGGGPGGVAQVWRTGDVGASWRDIGDADGDGLADVARVLPNPAGGQAFEQDLIRGRDGSPIVLGVTDDQGVNPVSSPSLAIPPNLTPEAKSRMTFGLYDPESTIKIDDILVSKEFAPSELRAMRIADGHKLWSLPLGGNLAGRMRLARFNASSGPQVVYMLRGDPRPAGLRLDAFDLESGNLAWSWQLTPDLHPGSRKKDERLMPWPVAVRLRRPNSREGMAVWTQSADGAPELAVIAPNWSGSVEIVNRIRLSAAPKPGAGETQVGSSSLDATQSFIVDANGDGEDDVVFLTRDFIVAMTLRGQELWRVPIRSDDLHAELRLRPDGALLIAGAVLETPVAWILDPSNGRFVEKLAGPHVPLHEYLDIQFPGDSLVRSASQDVGKAAVSAVERGRAWLEAAAVRPRSLARFPQANLGVDPREVRLLPWAVDPGSWFPPESQAMARTGATRLLASALLGVLLPLGAWRLFRRNFSLSRLLLIPPTIGALVAAIFGVPLNPDALRDQPWERLAHGLMMMTLSLPLALIIGCATRGQARLALTLLVAVIATHAAIVDVWLNLDAWRHGDFHYVSSGWAQPWFYALFANGCAIIAFFVIRGVVRVIGRLFVWIAWMRGTRLATLRG